MLAIVKVEHEAYPLYQTLPILVASSTIIQMKNMGSQNHLFFLAANLELPQSLSSLNSTMDSCDS